MPRYFKLKSVADSDGAYNAKDAAIDLAVDGIEMAFSWVDNSLSDESPEFRRKVKANLGRLANSLIKEGDLVRPGCPEDPKDFKYFN